MKAFVERADMPSAARFRFVEQPVVSAEDAADYGPVALGTREHAHVFASCEEAGKWVDTNSQYGDFVIHGVKS